MLHFLTTTFTKFYILEAEYDQTILFHLIFLKQYYSINFFMFTVLILKNISCKVTMTIEEEEDKGFFF
jgi:hypothetical protein